MNPAGLRVHAEDEGSSEDASLPMDHELAQIVLELGGVLEELLGLDSRHPRYWSRITRHLRTIGGVIDLLAAYRGVEFPACLLRTRTLEDVEIQSEETPNVNEPRKKRRRPGSGRPRQRRS